MILIDTHTLIWFLEGDSQISPVAVSTIENNPGTTFVSIASLWEIGIKSSLGKLDINLTFQGMVQEISKNAIAILPISESDIAAIITLPFHHRDPFDRIIIAQSQNNNFPIVSKDPHFKTYGVQLIW